MEKQKILSVQKLKLLFSSRNQNTMNHYKLLDMWQQGQYLDVADYLSNTSHGEILKFATLLVKACGQSELDVFSRFFV